MGVLPSDCIVFTASENATVLAKKCGMYVCGLQRYTPPEKLFHAGADEVVDNILHSKALTNSMYASPDFSLFFDDIVARFITMQEVEEKIIGGRVRATSIRSKIKMKH